MASIATLSLGGKEFDVLDCDYKLERDADGKGRPVSDIYGGEVRVRVESTEDTSILEHMASRFKPVSGKRCLQERRRGGEDEGTDPGKRLHDFPRGIRDGFQARDADLCRFRPGIEEMINQHEVGGNEVKADASEGIAATPGNRTLPVEKSTDDEPVNLEVVTGLTYVEQVFARYKPQSRIIVALLSLFTVLSCDNTVQIIELDKFKSVSGKYKNRDNRYEYFHTVLIKNPPKNDDSLKSLMVQYFCRREHYIDSIDPGCILGIVSYYEYTSKTAYLMDRDQDPGELQSNTLDMYRELPMGAIVAYCPCKDDTTKYHDFMDARKSPRDTLHWECGDTYIDNWHKYTEYKRKNRVDAGTAVVTQPKTFEVKGDSAVLILYPSKIEADSLIMLWGEDWFLSVKYYENYKLSLIRDLLNDKNVSCQTTDNRIIHFVESEIYFDKITIDDAWCVITCDKGKITRQNTDDYLEANM